MTAGVSCTVDVLHVAGERHHLRRTRETCSDCAAPRGALHHVGCDAQPCPCCRRQLIGCDCIFDEDLDEPTIGAFVGPVLSTPLDVEREPVWEPLAALALAARRDPELPSFHEGEFMYMATVGGDGGDIHLYKHRDTRRYLNLDEQGNAYGYRGQLSLGGGDHGSCYQRYPSWRDALDSVQLWLFERDRPLFRSFPPDAWPVDEI